MSTRSSGRPPGFDRSGIRNRHPLPVFERRPPPLFGSSRKGPLGPFLVVPSLPFVPVVSPPVLAGAHGRAQRIAGSLRSLKARMGQKDSRKPRDPGACQAPFLARCRRGGPVDGLPSGAFPVAFGVVVRTVTGETRAPSGSASSPLGAEWCGKFGAV